MKGEGELQNNMVRRHWRDFTIRDTIWHVWDAWKEVTQSCICGVWKKLCPLVTADFKGSGLTEKHLKLAKIVGLDELEEEDGGPKRTGEAAASVGGRGGG